MAHISFDIQWQHLERKVANYLTGTEKRFPGESIVFKEIDPYYEKMRYYPQHHLYFSFFHLI